MKTLLGSVIICCIFAVVSVSAQRDYCFKNDGLKLQQTVSFTLTKNKVEGTMESGGYDEDTSAETFEFTGIKIGDRITVKFREKPPYELPPRTKSIIWTFNTRSLRVPMYGKNYVTGRYSIYSAVFGKCKEI